MSAPPPSASERVSAPPPCVLLVDDEDAVRAALRRFFTRRGWTVVEAPDGESAKALLAPAANPFQVVICDLAMPRVSGRDLYEWLSGHRPEALAKLVFSSGDVLSRDASRFLAESGRPVLPKPFELAELSRIVEDVTRAAHAA